ncbi:MAG: DUF2262 domain-containing protein [Clostridia bacterium]|nr:DUF2262 domain-containing protein [Clostridia bacterium]
MEGNNRFTIALRYKEKPKTYTKGINASILMTVFSFALALLMLFIQTADNDSPLRYVLFGILAACSLFFLFVALMLRKAKTKSLKLNTFPEEAIYFDNGDICIQTDQITRIKCSDIKKVKAVHYEEVKSYGPVQQRITLPEGCITIISQEKKYLVPQLRNVDAVKELILRIKNSKSLFVNTTLFLYDGKNTDTYFAHLQLKGISVQITLDAAEENLSKSNATACKIIKGFGSFHNRVLEATAEQLTPLANEWNEEYFPAEKPFTTDDFINTIKNNAIYISINRDRYTVIWDDDGELFFGHAILCEGNIDEDEIIATIAG